MKQRITSLQKELFCPKYIFCCSPENPLLPLGILHIFFFESFFPFVLSFAALSQVSVGAHKDSFYSSHLKNNFRCHLFCLLFLGRRFSSQPGLNGPSLLQQSHSAAYKCLKKESSSQSKTTSKLGRAKGRTQ